MNGELTNKYKDWSDKQDLDRCNAAKAMIMRYPHYTDEQRHDWIECIDASMEVRKQAYINASDALEEAFKNYKKI